MERSILWVSVFGVALNASAAGMSGEAGEWGKVAWHIGWVLVGFVIIWLETAECSPTISTTKHTQGEG